MQQASWCSGYHICFTSFFRTLVIAKGRRFDPCWGHLFLPFCFSSFSITSTCIHTFPFLSHTGMFVEVMIFCV